MADDQEQEQGEQEPSWAKRLRQENEQLKREVREYKTSQMLNSAGFDPDSGIGKALVELHKGDLTAEALAETAKQYGFEPATATTEPEVDPVAQERSESTARIDELRANATPVGSQSMPYEEYKQLSQVNPGEAAKVLQAGKVADLPPFVAQSIAANRAERANTFGA